MPVTKPISTIHQVYTLPCNRPLPRSLSIFKTKNTVNRYPTPTNNSLFSFLPPLRLIASAFHSTATSQLVQMGTSRPEPKSYNILLVDQSQGVSQPAPDDLDSSEVPLNETTSTQVVKIQEIAIKYSRLIGTNITHLP